MKITQNDVCILNELKNNCRSSFISISKKYDIPLATVFDRMKRLLKHRYLLRLYSLIDYTYLRCPLHIVLICSQKKECRDELFDSPWVDSIIKVSRRSENGLIIFDTHFRTVSEKEVFLKTIKPFFKILKEHAIHSVLKKESFQL